MATVFSRSFDWSKFKEELENIKNEMANKTKEAISITKPETQSPSPASPTSPLTDKVAADLETKKMLYRSIPQEIFEKSPLLQTIAGVPRYLGLTVAQPLTALREATERAIGIEPIKPYTTSEEIARRREELLPGGPTLRPFGEMLLKTAGYRTIPSVTTPTPAPTYTPPPSPEGYFRSEKELPITKPLPETAPTGMFYQYTTPEGTVGFADTLEKIPPAFRSTAKLRRFEDVGYGIFGGGGAPAETGAVTGIPTTGAIPTAPQTYREYFRNPITGELVDLGERTYIPGQPVVKFEPMEYQTPTQYSEAFRMTMEKLLRPKRGYMPGYGYYTGYTPTQLRELSDIARTIVGKDIEERAISPYRQAASQRMLAETIKTIAEAGYLPVEKQAEIFEKVSRGIQARRAAEAPYLFPPGHTGIFPGGGVFTAPMPVEKGSVMDKIYQELDRLQQTQFFTPEEYNRLLRERIKAYRPALEKTGEWAGLPKELKKKPYEEWSASARAYYKTRKGLVPTEEQLRELYGIYLETEE